MASVPVMCIPWTTHHSNIELGKRSSATMASVPLRSPALNREISSCALPGRICLSVMSRPEYDVGIEMMCLMRGSNAAARIDM